MQKTKGFTLIEIVISLAVMVLLSVVVLQSFTNFRNSGALNASADDFVSLLEEARNATLSSRNASVYGVHITATSTVFFVGPTYSESASTNKRVVFDSHINATTTVSGSNIVFTRLTGGTTNTGTTTFYLVSNSGKQKTVYVGSGGIIER